MEQNTGYVPWRAGDSVFPPDLTSAAAAPAHATTATMPARGASAAPRARPAWHRWHHLRSVRAVMLLATVSLLGGLVVTLLTLGGQPVRTTSDDLVRDLRAGEAAEVQSSPDGDGTTRVAWQSGGIAYVASVPAPRGSPTDVAAALERQAAAAGRPVEVEVLAAPPSGGSADPGRTAPVLLIVGAVASLLTLLIMLSYPWHSLTSRWGWFWLFGTPLGPPLYWLLEPSPLWWTADTTAAVERPYRGFGGGIAYLVSIGLEVLFAVAVAVIVVLGLLYG